MGRKRDEIIEGVDCEVLRKPNDSTGLQQKKLERLSLSPQRQTTTTVPFNGSSVRVQKKRAQSHLNTTVLTFNGSPATEYIATETIHHVHD